jgi:hypothetical protein
VLGSVTTGAAGCAVGAHEANRRVSRYKLRKKRVFIVKSFANLGYKTLHVTESLPKI